MGLLQPHGRRRGRDGQARLRTIAVSNLPQARAAIAAARVAGEKIRLATPPDAIIQYGVLHFVKMTERLQRDFPELKSPLAVDCGDRGDLAHAAMRHGLRNVVFRGDPRIAEKLAAIAAELGIRFESHSPP